MNNKFVIGVFVLVVVISLIGQAMAIKYNVDSIYDEGFLFYSIQSAFQGEINGGTQYANIIATTLGVNGCAHIATLRIVRYILTIITALLFACLTFSHFSKDKWDVFGYFVICMLMVLPTIGGIVLCYNGLAQFFDCLALALGFLILTQERKENVLYCFMMGALLVFGLFSILPSAILLMGCLFILLLVRYWKIPKRILFYSGTTILGICFGLLLFHLFVANLGTVFAAMLDTASSITTLNRGYDPISFIIKIILFLRDWMLMGLVVIGAIAFSKYISKWGNAWLGNVLLVGLLLVYAYYQKKPAVTTGMLISSIWIGLLYEKYQDKEIKHISEMLNFDVLLNMFLVFSPLILSIGTNVYLGGKMSYFLLPWALLIYRLGFHERIPKMVFAICVFITFWMLIPLKNMPTTIRSQETVVQEGPLKGMHLTQKQAEHFGLCDSIVHAYGFNEKSVIFTTQLGAMTNCYLNAETYANYFQPMDFLANPHIGKKAPDFMFLYEYDEDIAGNQFRQMGWDWPNSYDVYDVGTPEIIDTGYPTERKLYCRKIK